MNTKTLKSIFVALILVTVSAVSVSATFSYYLLPSPPPSAANTLVFQSSANTDFSVLDILFNNNPGYQTIGVGINITNKPLTVKGTSVGLKANISKTGGPDPQKGSASSSLATSQGFFYSGSFIGVNGKSIPNSLQNYDKPATSYGLGGFFVAKPDNTLTLDNTGTYWIGGAYGEVAGTIDSKPKEPRGAVAGIIGIDNSVGSAKSYAGYFQGDVKTTGYMQLALTSGAPPLTDCDENSELGRMKVDNSGTGNLYICTKDNLGNIVWIAK